MRIRAAIPVGLLVFLGATLVQWDGKDGFCALDGLFVVKSIERMDGIFPHGKDFQSFRPFRSQTPVLIPAGEVEGPVLSTLGGNRLRVIMRRREKTKRYRRALSIELRVRSVTDYAAGGVSQVGYQSISGSWLQNSVSVPGP